MSSTNGQPPTPPASPRNAARFTSRGAGQRAATPLSTKIAMALLWLAVLDRDDAAITQALALLPDDQEVRGIALGMCRIGLSIEPRLRCDVARSNAYDLLETYDLSHRVITGRH